MLRPGRGSFYRRFSGSCRVDAWSELIKRDVPEDLKVTLDPFCGNLIEIGYTQFRSLYGHLKKLRTEGNTELIYEVGLKIMSRWKKEGKEIKRSLPHPFYEEMVATLASETHSTADHADIALSLVDEMAKKKMSISPETLNNVSSLVCRSGDSFLKYRLMALTTDIVKLRNRVSKTALKQILNNSVQQSISCDELESAFMLMMQAGTRSDIRINQHVNEILLLSLLAKNEMELAWAILKNMHVNMKVFSRIWGAFISAAVDNHYYEALDWLRNTAIISGRIVVGDACYLKMADVVSSHGDYRMTRWCVLRTKRREAVLGLPSRVRMIEQFMIPLIESHAVSGNILRAFKLMERMNETTASLSFKQIPRLVDALSKSHTFMQIAIERLQKACGDPHVSDAVRMLMFSLICAGFLQSSNARLAVRVYDQLISSFELRPNADILRRFLNYAVDNDDHNLIRKISADCEKFEISKSEVSRGFMRRLEFDLEYLTKTGQKPNFTNQLHDTE